ncbi:HET domain protein pin-c2 [Sordaria brevicollis]|uniref:HET domain protein pin-c2 n=1 Tax=Sordaria brevicollis TaxID=83679 RepID=A0AAE0P2Q6_SORBR|nr:HET domain protein pin-c2 [Sordaria brevicollis]
MAPKLCDVCSKVPVWLDSLSWDTSTSTRNDPTITLRPWKDMQAVADRHECDLCQMIAKTLDSADRFRIEDSLVNTPFTLSREKHYRSVYGSNVYNYYATCGPDVKVRGSVCTAPFDWCSRFLPPMGYNENNLECNILLIKDWLDHCQRNHTQCQNPSDDFLPTRLLDVEAYKPGQPPYLGNDLRLVSLDPRSLGHDLPSYITLSHCWGPPSKRPVTTTTTNLSGHLTRISFLSLPQTFRDAVETTRRLGIRYLWIDSLCIIQDCKEDWAREASLMSKVFSYAYCTLASLSSMDGSEGLQVFNVQSDERPFFDISTIGHRYRIFADTPNLWSWSYKGDYSGNVYGFSPLRFRAWVLQERELSRRTVHFSKEGLLWECKEMKGTAQVPWEDIERHRQEQPYWHDKQLEDEWHRHQNTRPESANAMLLQHKSEQHWWRLIEDYSGRLLTQETDRLIALSGVARAHQEEYFPNGGVKYGAGLWSCHLPEGLLWYVIDNESSRPEQYVAPSWSWASVKGRVKYVKVPLADRFKRATARLTSEEGQGQGQGQRQRQKERRSLHLSLADQVRNELRVEEVKVSLKYDDPYGALNDATLVLSGARMVEVDSITQPSVKETGFMNLYKKGVYVGSAKPDVSGGPEACGGGGGLLMCLGVGYEDKYGGDLDMMGLLLVEEEIQMSEEQPGPQGVTTFTSSVYRRVGYFSFMGVECFEGVEPRRVMLK